MNNLFRTCALLILLASCNPSPPRPSVESILASSQDDVSDVGNQMHGKVLFQQNCASCHSIYKQVTGPVLHGVMERWNHDTVTLFRFIHNSSEVIASRHKYSVDLFNRFDKQLMPAFPGLTDQDISDIFSYVEDDCHYKPKF